MAKRYYVSKIIGTGAEFDPYRPAIQDVLDPSTGLRAFNFSAVIATHPVGHPNAGKPVRQWALVVATGQKHGLLANDVDNDQMPEYPLDAKVSAMHVPTRNQMAAKLQARGIDISGIATADGFREVIRGIGRAHDPAFDENNFDVAE